MKWYDWACVIVFNIALWGFCLSLFIAILAATDLVPVPRKVVDERPVMCYHLYNNGNHEEWAACMGVPYVRN